MDNYVYREIPELAAMAENPDLRDKLTGFDWAKLLSERPEFAACCNWDLLNGGAWVNLLIHRPEFSDICPWEKVCKADWWNLLEFQPQFIDVCDWPWERVEGDYLADVFRYCRNRDMLEERCPWDRLTGDQWDWCLTWLGPYSLGLGDKCRWEKLNAVNWMLLLLDGGLQYAFLCPWDKLDGSAWLHLLARHPQLAGLCDWRKLAEELTADGWKMLLDAQPQLASRCPDEIASAYACASARKPETTPSVGDVESNSEYVEILIKKVNEGERLNTREWSELIIARPEFADKCDWSLFDGYDLASILTARPEFADKCDWRELDGDDWAWLLAVRPEFANRCDWSKLSKWEWSYLVFSRPDMVFSFHLPNDEACEVIKAAWPLLAEYRHSSQS